MDLKVFSFILLFLIIGVSCFALPPPPEIKVVPLENDFVIFVLRDSDTETFGLLNLSPVGTITVDKSAGDYILASNWNDNFTNIKTWIDNATGQGAIGSADIAAGGVGTTEIASNAVTSTKIAANGVATSDVQDTAIQQRFYHYCDDAADTDTLDTTVYNTTLIIDETTNDTTVTVAGVVAGDYVVVNLDVTMTFAGTTTVGALFKLIRYEAGEAETTVQEEKIQENVKKAEGSTTSATAHFMWFDSPGAGDWIYEVRGAVAASDTVYVVRKTLYILHDRGK